MANLGVPVKLLHESLGHVVTVELKTGEVSDGSVDWYKIGLDGVVLMPFRADVPREVDGGCVWFEREPSSG